MLILSSGASSLADEARRRFSVADFLRMGRAGILTENDRVELIDGEIRDMTPVGPLHAGTVSHLAPLIAPQMGKKYTISIQNPVELSDYSQPQPDLAVLRLATITTSRSHPTPADVLLVIEVADQSEEYDRQEKIPRYAASGIPEAWLVAVGRATIKQYTECRNGRYCNVRILTKGDRLACQSGPSLELAVAEIFA